MVASNEPLLSVPLRKVYGAKVYPESCSKTLSSRVVWSTLQPTYGGERFNRDGNAIGDVASVLFTAGFSDNIPTSLHEPAATLPLAIFFQLGSPIEEVQGRGYASALILTIIVLIITVLADILIKKFSKHKI